ncbi:hypothetical protein M8J77_021584 [Diaphorina citri]|nr:hypothetical protein M8J77_021584 [Diaphorina citri]
MKASDPLPDNIDGFRNLKEFPPTTIKVSATLFLVCMQVCRVRSNSSEQLCQVVYQVSETQKLNTAAEKHFPLLGDFPYGETHEGKFCCLLVLDTLMRSSQPKVKRTWEKKEEETEEKEEENIEEEEEREEKKKKDQQHKQQKKKRTKKERKYRDMKSVLVLAPF